jgi:hypothetical protein
MLVSKVAALAYWMNMLARAHVAIVARLQVAGAWALVSTGHFTASYEFMLVQEIQSCWWTPARPSRLLVWARRLFALTLSVARIIQLSATLQLPAP